MIYLFLIAVAALALTIVSFRYAFDYNHADGWIILAMGGLLATIFLFLIPSITLGSRVVGRTTCRNWGRQAGVKSEFVILNWFDTGTCLGLTPNGRWVVNSNWQAFVDASK